MSRMVVVPRMAAACLAVSLSMSTVVLLTARPYRQLCPAVLKCESAGGIDVARAEAAAAKARAELRILVPLPPTDVAEPGACLGYRGSESSRIVPGTSRRHLE